jgi:hypothetical protein
MKLLQFLKGGPMQVKEKLAKDWWTNTHPIKSRFLDETEIVEAFVAGFCNAKLILVKEINKSELRYLPRHSLLDFILQLGNHELSGSLSSQKEW